MEHCGGRIQARLENRRSEHYCIVGSHSTLCLVILSASSSTCIFTNKPRTIERDEAQTEGEFVCLCIPQSHYLSRISRCISTTWQRVSAARDLNQWPETIPRQAVDFCFPSKHPSIHPSIRPTPSLACKSNPHAAQCSAPESVSDTSGGRKSNLFDWDIICIGFTVAIRTVIKTNHSKSALAESQQSRNHIIATIGCRYLKPCMTQTKKKSFALHPMRPYHSSWGYGIRPSTRNNRPAALCLFSSYDVWQGPALGFLLPVQLSPSALSMTCSAYVALNEKAFSQHWGSEEQLGWLRWKQPWLTTGDSREVQLPQSLSTPNHPRPRAVSHPGHRRKHTHPRKHPYSRLKNSHLCAWQIFPFIWRGDEVSQPVGNQVNFKTTQPANQQVWRYKVLTDMLTRVWERTSLLRR